MRGGVGILETKTSGIPRRLGAEAFVMRHEKAFILALCAIAALRVFLFSAAFPFFNNVDEMVHFDTVVKNSRAYLPAKGGDRFGREAVDLIVPYHSPEYKIEYASASEIPPPMYNPLGVYRRIYIGEITDLVMNRTNYMAFSPPVYYRVAGTWYWLGKLAGLGGGYLLYWVRFLNVAVYALLMWSSYVLCRRVYSENLPVRVGVPLMLVFFPQDFFYSINSDVFSPLFFLVSLYLLIRFYTSDTGRLFHFVTGLTVALTFLVKLSNLPVLVVFGALFLLRIRGLYAEARLKDQAGGLVLLVLALIVPIALWTGWNAYALGDLTGAAKKAADFSWTVKPLAELGNHPIFTLNGAAYFFDRLIESFWRGEFLWGKKILASGAMDLFYVVSSCVFLFAAVAGRLLGRDTGPSDQRLAHYMNLAILLIFVVFMAALSIIYDFGYNSYPSRARPYFVSGRLISGALVPFLMLYLNGLIVVLSRITRRVSPLLVVLLIVVLMAYSEIRLTYPVFSSLYNWFHL